MGRNWPKKYKIGIDDEEVKVKITGIEQISSFLSEQLQKPQYQPREYSKECLQLFLGGVAAQNISFRAPGAMHHGRWIAKAIYSLKFSFLEINFL